MKNQHSLKVLITGAKGLLGTGLLLSTPSKYEVIPTFLRNDFLNKNNKSEFIKLDITDKKNVLKIFDKLAPDVVIHAASIGNVDFCEKNRDDAYLVNVTGTKNIVSACNKINTKLVFLSSNAVFDGQNPEYSEISRVNPTNYYGKTKVLGEEIVQKYKGDFLIVRLILMYGWNYHQERLNPVTWLIKELKKKNKVVMVNDTYTNPVLNVQAAKAIWQLLEKGSRGIFHIAGKERINRFEFAKKIADVFNFDKKLISPVTSDYFKGIAKRMPDTTYDLTKIIQEIGYKPLNITKGLQYMKNNKLI